MEVYLTEQQMQPLPTSIHSVTSWPPWLTVNGFSMSEAVNNASQFEWRDNIHVMKAFLQSPNS